MHIIHVSNFNQQKYEKIYTKREQRKNWKDTKESAQFSPRFASFKLPRKLKKAKLFTLQSRSVLHQLATMHEMKLDGLELCFMDFFIASKYKKTRGNIFKLVIPKTKTNIRQNFFSCSVIKYWNDLKSSDINIWDSRQFKKKLLKYLLRKKWVRQSFDKTVGR